MKLCTVKASTLKIGTKGKEKKEGMFTNISNVIFGLQCLSHRFFCSGTELLKGHISPSVY